MFVLLSEIELGAYVYYIEIVIYVIEYKKNTNVNLSFINLNKN